MSNNDHQRYTERNDERPLPSLLGKGSTELEETLSRGMRGNTNTDVQRVLALDQSRAEGILQTLSFDELRDIKNMGGSVGRWENRGGIDVLAPLDNEMGWVAMIERNRQGQWKYRINPSYDPRHPEVGKHYLLIDREGLLSKPLKTREAAIEACNRQLRKGIGVEGKKRFFLMR